MSLQHTIDETQQALLAWRLTKGNKKDPIPNNIRHMIKELASHHESEVLIQKLKIHLTTLNSIRQQLSYNNPPLMQEPHKDAPRDVSNFIPFKIVPHNSTDNTTQKCEFVNKNGDRLIITTANLDNLIKDFLCCN